MQRWAALALVFLLLGVAWIFLPPVVDYVLFAPWAYGYFGQPTLTGDWVGNVRSPRGTRYVVYLELRRSTSRGNPTRVRHGRAAIDGSASWCTHGTPNTAAPLNGSADRSASDVSLGIGDRKHPRAGLEPSTFRGAWHGSTLVVQVGFRRLNRQGAAVRSSTNADDTETVSVTFRKSEEATYRSACAGLYTG